MKSMLAVCLLGLLPSALGSACPNNCNNHGSCGTSSQCECYRNWFGADCSQRVCTYGLNFIDNPIGDLDGDSKVSATRAFDPRENSLVVSTQNVIGGASELYNWKYGYARHNTTTVWNEAHFYGECSNKGVCNRATGLCQCFPGYEGEGCIRQACPNSCSGHGSCRTIEDAWNTGTYSAWDKKKTQLCRCDPGYEGPDCSLRTCPRGADPVKFAHQVTNSVQGVLFRASTKKNVNKKIYYTLTTSDEFGDSWTTRLMSIDYTSDTGVPTVGVTALKKYVENVNQSLSWNDGIEDGFVWGVHAGVVYPSAAQNKDSNSKVVFVDSQRFRLDAGIATATAAVCGTGKKGLCLFIQNQNHGKQSAYRVDFWYNGHSGTGTAALKEAVTSGQTVGFGAIGTEASAATDLDLVTVVDVQSKRQWLKKDGDVTKTFINLAQTALDSCSNRGLCDYTTGLCGCFAGYTGIACTEQNSIAYTY